MTRNTFKAEPIAKWSDIGKTEHVVQFYRDDKLLVSAVSGYFNGALRAKEAAVMIATPAHRHAVEKQLREEGLELEALQACGHYFSLDAAEILSKFMVDGLPDERLFNVTIGGVMSRATKNNRGVRAFGEMVALLWADGNKEAAIRLEDLWNNLAQSYSFALFCAYPLHSFENGHGAAPFVHICSQHSRVISSENCGA